jgi:outer membrane scaffolding protein for murein synthesis (MipA/OmpV family)
MLRLLALTTCLAAPALAQEASPSFDPQRFGEPVGSTQGAVDGPALGFTLRGGVGTAPTYFGSDENEAVPDLGFELNYLRLGGFTVGDPDPLFRPQGLGVTGSFRFVGERDASDDAALTGLDDVDAALELGAGLRYATPNVEVFGAVRYGVIGHEAWVGEIGADAFLRPNDRLTLRAGPRIFLGDDDYAATYFGVSGAEAAASGGALPSFDAEGGVLSTGLEVGAGYRINDSWGIDAAITYERLRNDAEDSPISLDDDQISARIGLTRRFTLGF